MPQHLPSGRGVSGHFSFWTQSVKAFVLRRMHATASDFWTRNVRAFFLRDAECHRNVLRPTRDSASAFWMSSVRAFFIPDTVCHGTTVTLAVKAQNIVPNTTRVIFTTT